MRKEGEVRANKRDGLDYLFLEPAEALSRSHTQEVTEKGKAGGRGQSLIRGCLSLGAGG